MARSFDKTVKKMCRKKIADPTAPLLGERFTVEEALSEALIRRAMGGASDALKLIREILDEGGTDSTGSFSIDINVVE